MNDFDKAGRYLIKRDPPGFFRWLLRRPDVAFQAWIDTRRLALPDQGDLTNDLVAAFRVGDAYEALCLELQAQSAGPSAPRLLLGCVPSLRTGPRGRRSLAGLALTFADLAACRDVWEAALEGWAVIKSPYLEALREQVRAQARAEGEAKGQLRALRETVLRLGEHRFGKAAGRKQQA